MKVTSPGIVALGICFALSAAAAQPTVNFGITAVGADNLAGVYTDPYHGLINGTTEIAAFCDDFTDDAALAPPNANNRLRLGSPPPLPAAQASQQGWEARGSTRSAHQRGK